MLYVRSNAIKIRGFIFPVENKRNFFLLNLTAFRTLICSLISSFSVSEMYVNLCESFKKLSETLGHVRTQECLGAIFVTCHHWGIWCLYFVVSLSGSQASFSGCIAPSCSTTSCHKDLRSLFSLWIELISKLIWPPQLPGEFRMNYAWQMVLQCPYLRTSYFSFWKHVDNGSYLHGYIKR